MGLEKNPKVSIVIPVYNGSNFLADAIDSALAQTYKNTEIIVVNDGSTDGGATEKIAESYGDRIRYYHKTNGGVATALNFGIEKMTGQYFSWLSHDDLYERTKVADQVAFIKSFGANTIVVSNARALFESGVKKKELIDKKTFEYIDIFLATSARVGINGCALLIPRKALVDSKGFNKNLPTTQDYDLWFRLASKFKYRFVLLDKNLVLSRRHDKQDSVRLQDVHLEESDKLHYNILKTIDYKRFEEYFRADKANFAHTWANYNLYKSRGFKNTASMMLKNILRYCYENDREKFYEVYGSELETGRQTNGRRTDADRQRMAGGYKKLLDSGTDDYPIKESVAVRESQPPRTRMHRIVRRLNDSIRRDGLYLTGEKVIRKAHRKIIRKIRGGES